MATATAAIHVPRKPTAFSGHHIGLHLALMVGAVIMILPFLEMVSTSLKTSIEVRQAPLDLIPATLSFSNYPSAMNAMPFDRFYVNSLIVAAAVTVLDSFLSSLAAFAFARLRFKGRNALFFMYLIGLMIPAQVLLVPNFIIIRQLGWFDTYFALIVPSSFSATGIFLMRQYYRTIPLEYDEAARMDGASSLRIWWNIILPNSIPILAARAVFIFLGSWNDFLWPLVVTNSQAMRTLPVGLSMFQGQFSVQWELLMAASVVALIPVLIIYFFAQNWIIKGLSISSGIKG